jgi:DNA (cytosine-5)-methyltransferase 1
MRANGIIDISIRMLILDELKAIQGFPAEYFLTGTKTNNLKFIGNSVAPLVAKKLVESNSDALCEMKYS